MLAGRCELKALIVAPLREVKLPWRCALAMSLQATNSCCGKIRNTTNVLRGGRLNETAAR